MLLISAKYVPLDVVLAIRLETVSRVTLDITNQALPVLHVKQTFKGALYAHLQQLVSNV